MSHSPQGFSALVKRGLYECVRNINTINELETIPLALQISGFVGASRCDYLVDVVRAIPSNFLDVFCAKDYTDYRSQYRFEKELDERGREEDEAQTVLTSKGGFCENYVLRLAFQHESIQRSALLQEFMAKDDNGGNEGEPTCSMRDELWKLCQRWKELKRNLVANNLTEVEIQKNKILLKALVWTLDTIAKGFPPFNSTNHDTGS